MAVTTIPDALDYLVAAARDASAFDGVLVVDGWRTIDEAQDMLLLGFSTDPDVPAVRATHDIADLGRAADRESYAIGCAISCWSGDTDPKPVRDRAFTLLRGFDALLRADQRLGGTVLGSRLAVVDFAQGEYKRGAAATISVDIQVQAWAER